MTLQPIQDRFCFDLIPPEQAGKPGGHILIARAEAAQNEMQELLSDDSRQFIQLKKRHVLQLASEQGKLGRSSAKWNVIISAASMALTTVSVIPNFEKLAGFIEPARSMGITWMSSGYDAKIVMVQAEREIEMQELSQKINDEKDSTLREAIKRLVDMANRTLNTASAPAA